MGTRYRCNVGNDTVDVYRTGAVRLGMYDNWQSVVGTRMCPPRNRLGLLAGRAVEYCGRNTDEQTDEPKRRNGRFLKSEFTCRRSVIGSVRPLETSLNISNLIGREYRSFDSQRRWELLFEDVLIVILDTGVKHGNDHNLVGIDATDLRVRWAVGGIAGSQDRYDGVVNVWVDGCRLWAGTWSGFSLQVDHRSGEIVEQLFTK